MVGRWGTAALLLLLAASARANDLLVDPRTLQMNDLTTITISLEGPFASMDDVRFPLQNLALVGEPWVSSEFAWINGEVVRRKVFRYRARPMHPGPARVGPIVLDAGDGQRDTLAAVALQVIADRTSASNDAETVLRELMATGRDPVFVVAEVEKQTVYIGEPLVVSWVLYNAASVQQWQILSVPELADFWTEELTRNENPERVYVGDLMMQRLTIRRVALFPLRSGRLHVTGMAVEAAVMRRTRSGPFAMFEGDLVETTFTSAPFDLEVKPIPPGGAVDAIGDLTLTCDPPTQRNAGPVVMNVTLAGLGNIRAAKPPRFERGVAGTVQIEGGQVSVTRDELPVEMTRKWEYVIFPAATGVLEIPPLTMQIFVPRAALRRELRCSASILDVVAAAAPAPSSSSRESPRERRVPWTWLAAIAALLLALLMALPRVRRELALRREARTIVRDATPAEIRVRMEQLAIPLDEASDRGDAWRALRSLLVAAERERDISVNAEEEIARRVREVLRIAT